MRCKFSHARYKGPDGFCVFLYHTQDLQVPVEARRHSRYGTDWALITAVGYGLTDTSSVDVELEGIWQNSKYGMQLNVTSCREVLPNIIGPIITQIMFSIPTAIFTEAFLSFVGLGIPVPQCSLGSLINELYNSFTTHPYQIIPPITVMVLLMLSFNLVADGLREALDPKMKSM